MSPELTRAFASLTTGIYVLTVKDGEHLHGMSASWVTQVSAAPPLLMAAVGRAHATHAAIERHGCFGLNIVGQHSRGLEDYFYSSASRHADNLKSLAVELSTGGVPLLCDALLGMECQVRDTHRAGDRSLFIASVEAVHWGKLDAPLTSLDLEYVYVGELIAQVYERRGQS